MIMFRVCDCPTCDTRAREAITGNFYSHRNEVAYAYKVIEIAHMIKNSYKYLLAHDQEW